MKNSQVREYTSICMKFPPKNVTHNVIFPLTVIEYLVHKNSKMHKAVFNLCFSFEDENISFLFLKHDITESMNETAMFELSFGAFFRNLSEFLHILQMYITTQ
jgi:hypothetical protein